MALDFPGKGRKRLQLDISIYKLHLDVNNPRLPENVQGKSEKEVLLTLYREFDLRELAESMAKNGYFDEEPLIIIPKILPKNFEGKDYNSLREDKKFISFLEYKNTPLIVVEGNRRLAAARILLSGDLRRELKVREWPVLSKPVKKDLMTLPVIVYLKREDVVPYLGVRHIAGIKKWEPYAKARYIAGMKDFGQTIDEIQQKVGDRSTSTRKIYTCYKLVQIMEEEEEGSADKAKELFSYLLLALGQGPIKEYLGIPKKWTEVDLENPVSKNKLPNLLNLFSFLFGERKGKLPVIKESRDITRKLSHVLRKKESADYLISKRDLDEAYERSDGEEILILKKLISANRNLEQSLGIIHRHKTKQVKAEVEKCKETLAQIFKIIGG